jgi:hypothetical protein
MTEKHQAQHYLAPIERLVRQTRKKLKCYRQIRLVGIFLCLWLPMSCLGVLSLTPHLPHLALRLLALALMPGSLAFLGIALLVIGLGPRPSRSETALFLETQNRALQNQLESSLQFYQAGQLPPSNPYSPELLAAALKGAASLVVSWPINPVSFRPLRKLLLITTFFLAGSVAIVSAQPDSFSRFFSYLMTGKLRPTGQYGHLAGNKQPSLIIGDISLHLAPPGYSQMPPLTMSNASGDATALKGTEITIRAQSSNPVLSAAMIVNQTEKIPLKLIGTQQLEGKIMLLKESSYRLDVRDIYQQQFVSESPHQLHLIEDEFPKIQIQRPDPEISVFPKDSVKISYSAEDDYGLRTISILFRAPESDQAQRKEIETFNSIHQTFRHEYTFLVAEIPGSIQGDTIYYALEAEDNDSISGPKKTATPFQVLKLQSAQKKYEDNIARIAALIDHMTDLLGDFLEFPIPGRTAEYRTMITAIRLHWEQIKDDSASLINPDADQAEFDQDKQNIVKGVIEPLSELFKKFDLFTRSLTWAKSEGNPESRATLQNLIKLQVTTLEKSILALINLTRLEKLAMLREKSRDFSDSQESLTQLLDQLDKDGANEGALAKEVMRELEKLRRKMEEFGRQLSQLQEGLPDEYLNPDAFNDLKMNQMADVMKELQAALARKDMKKVKKLLDQLLKGMNAMMSAFDETLENYQNESLSPLLQDMQQSLSELNEIQKEQAEILEKSETMLQRLRQKQLEQIASSMDSFLEMEIAKVKQVQEIIANIRSFLNTDPEAQAQNRPEAYERSVFLRNLGDALAPDLDSIKKDVDYLHDLLSIGDLYESLQTVEQSDEETAAMKQKIKEWFYPPPPPFQPLVQAVVQQTEAAAKIQGEIIQDLKRILDSPERFMDASDQQNKGDLSQRETHNRRNTRDLAKKLQEMMQENPFLPKSMPGSLNEGAQAMESAQENLRGSQLEQAISDERQALKSLNEAQNAVKSMQQRLKGAPQPGGGSSFGNGPPLFGGDSDAEEEGRQGLRPDKIVIPTPEQYKVPKKYREDIIKAMKGKKPQQYERDVTQYYEKLIQP